MPATRSIRSARGFSLPDLLVTIAVAATIMGVAVPIMTDVVDSMRLSIATREVERTLQNARMRSVSTNRAMQVRLNCPATGQLRMIEVTGIASVDSNPNRCDEGLFPFPGPADTDMLTPERDGPVVILHFTVGLAGLNVQFSPNGTAQQLVGSGGTFVVQPISTTPVAVTVSKDVDASTVTINGLGKIQIQ